MRGPAVFATTVVLLFAGAGCGSDDSAQTQESVEARQSREAQRQRGQRQVAIRRAHAQARREIAQRRARRAAHERQRQARERRARVAEEREEAEVEEESESSCDPNYSGACLDPSASDYDCEGGSGNGPNYTGTVTVIGEDHYGLDADSDGTGCESE
jgi:hypothetical protein